MGTKGRRFESLVSIAVLLIFVAGILLYFNQSAILKGDYSSDPARAIPGSVVKPVKLTLFCDVPDWTPAEWSLEEDTLTREISDNTGVYIEATVPAQDADMQLSLMLIDNQLPDLMIIRDPQMIRKLVSSGKVWELDAFFHEYMEHSEVQLAMNDASKAALTERDGGWYCVPTGIPLADSKAFDIQVIWNRELAARYGITEESVRLESSFISTMERVSEEAANDNTSHNKKTFIPLLFGGSNDQDKILDRLSATLGSSSRSRGRDFMNTLIEKKILSPDYLAYSVSQTQTLLEDSDVLCYIGNISHLKIDPDKWVSYDGIYDDGCAEPLVHDHQLFADCPGILISKGCTDLTDAGRFIDYMSGGRAAQTIERFGGSFDNWWIYETPLWDVYLDPDSSWRKHTESLSLLREGGDLS